MLDVLERALKTAAAALAGGAADDLWMAWTGAALDESVVFEHQRRAVAIAGVHAALTLIENSLDINPVP